MAFSCAGPAEIVRSSQKDEYFLTRLRSEVTELIQKIKGIRWWIKWHREVELFADISYFTLTTILGYQTLGEEYVNIVQLNQTKRKIPSTLTRTAMILFHVGGPYFINKWAQRIQAEMNRNPDFLSDYPNAKKKLQTLIPRLSSLIAILHRCHLVLFYFQVKYYHIAKRLTGIRYVLIRPWLEDSASRWGYWLLGLLSLIQLAISSAYYLYSIKSKSTTTLDHFSTADMKDCQNSASAVSSKMKCPLCLDVLSSPTATPCGHIFCWKCIICSLEMKQQCPLCNAKFEPSRLVFLKNYV